MLRLIDYPKTGPKDVFPFDQNRRSFQKIQTVSTSTSFNQNNQNPSLLVTFRKLQKIHKFDRMYPTSHFPLDIGGFPQATKLLVTFRKLQIYKYW